MHKLWYISTRVCVRMKNSTSTISKILVLNTNMLQYDGIRCHKAKGSQILAHAYTLHIS